MPPSAVPAKLVLYQDNTQQIRVFGLQDQTTGSFITTATMTATLIDKDRNQVAGLIAIPLTFQPGSNGNYFGLVGPDFSPTVGTDYTLVLEGDNGGSHLHIEILAEVAVRTK